MNAEHLKAILWLRWRTNLNRLKRSGRVNTALTLIIFALASLTAASSFFVALIVGNSLLPDATAEHLLYLWDIVVVAFLFFWTIGVVHELQRSDALSFEKLLHLPISLSGAFLLNYVNSLFSFSLIVFLPGMFGLCVALVITKGAGMLVMFPLLAGFVLMVTWLTYQLRGWLASLMANKRRRRTIVVMMTMTFILLAQGPFLFSQFYMKTNAKQHVAKVEQKAADLQEYLDENVRLLKLKEEGEIDQQEFENRLIALEESHVRKQNVLMTDRGTKQLQQVASTASAALPPGWMAYGAMAAQQGRFWPGILGAMGTCLIGAASLRRSYRTTLRLYLGDFQNGMRRHITSQKSATTSPAAQAAAKSNFIGKKLPWLREQPSAVALTNFRSLIRAPEVKMVLLSPMIMFIVFGSMLLTNAGDRSIPEGFRSAPPLGAIMMVMTSLMTLFLYQFGLDRDGFRVFVLSPASRRDILLGKNLSLLPITLGFGMIAVMASLLISPLSVTGFAAAIIQLVSAHFIVCMVGNYASIHVPVGLAAGTLRTSKPTMVTSLLGLLFMLAMVISLLPIAIPMLVEVALSYLKWGQMIPANLVLSILLLGGVLYVYRRTLTQQGQELQEREQRILDVLTTKYE